MPREHTARYGAGLETTLLQQARRIIGALPGSADHVNHTVTAVILAELITTGRSSIDHNAFDPAKF